MTTNSTICRLAIALALAFGIASTTEAVSFSVSPIVVTLNKIRHSATLKLKNEGRETRVIETELRHWTSDDIDVPTRDILVTPADLTLGPGQSRTIRLFLNRKAPKSQERAYRFYADEVPPPLKPGDTGLRIALRIGVPVFVSPEAKPVTRLDWKASRPAGAMPELTIANNGNVHVRLTSLKISDPFTNQLLFELPQTRITLLAGQAQQIPLAVPKEWNGTEFKVYAGSDRRTFESRIKVK
jgi:fimbrial chaperone protein